jgi:fructose-bisphosphate aldolase, class II
MSRTTSGKLVAEKVNSSTAIGAFNVILLEHAEALVMGAEKSQLPLILQISENCVKYHGALKPISVATIAIAEASTLPISVHLDHAESEELVKQALDLGYDSVMFDGSKLGYKENVQASQRMRALCDSYGATLEVEIGEVGGKDGVHAPGIRTKPAEAKDFANETGANLIAVAVGSSHAMSTRDASLDFQLIRDIAAEVKIPLVLHGSSGVSDGDLQEAVRAGMRKINIATHLNGIFTDRVRAELGKNPSLTDPRKYIGLSRDDVSDEVARLLKLLNLN